MKIVLSQIVDQKKEIEMFETGKKKNFKNPSSIKQNREQKRTERKFNNFAVVGQVL